MTKNERIKEVRKQFNLTQEAFAKKLGLKSISAVSMMEKNNGIVSDRNVQTISEKFGVSEIWLLYGEGDMLVENPTHEQIDSFFADILNDDSDFRTRFISALARMSKEEWNTLERKISEIAGEYK